MLNVRLTAEGFLAVVGAADEAGVSRSEWVRGALQAALVAQQKEQLARERERGQLKALADRRQLWRERQGLDPA